MICGMDTTALHERMKTMVGKTTFRALGQATNHNPETVRRYMSGQAPSVEFLSALVGAYSVNADWLLTGRGPRDRSEVRSEVLAQADPNELMSAIACRMEDMCDRIDRIEIFVQTMETRLRTAATPTDAGPVASIQINPALQTTRDDKGAPNDVTFTANTASATKTTDDPAAARAGAIADALTRRPHPDAC